VLGEIGFNTFLRPCQRIYWAFDETDEGEKRRTSDHELNSGSVNRLLRWTAG
jgi:hypothetical protein